MFIPEMNDDDFHRYYRMSWAMVTWRDGTAKRSQWLMFREQGNWRSATSAPVMIPRENIIDIQVPAIGYHVLNGVPVFSSRVPSRTTTKGLSAENSRSHVPKDFAVLTGAAVDWVANKQPLFTEWYGGSITNAIALMVRRQSAFQVISPELFLCLNCTDGTPNVFANLYYREFLIGKYNEKGLLWECDGNVVRQLGVA